MNLWEGVRGCLCEWPCVEYVVVLVMNYKRVAAGGSSQHLTGSPPLACSEVPLTKSDPQSGAAPGSLLQMQILKPCPRPAESGFLRVVSRHLCFHKYSRVILRLVPVGETLLPCASFSSLGRTDLQSQRPQESSHLLQGIVLNTLSVLSSVFLAVIP